MRCLVKSWMCAWRIRARRIRDRRGQNAPARSREGREDPIPREGGGRTRYRGPGGGKKELGYAAAPASDARKRQGPVEQGDSEE